MLQTAGRLRLLPEAPEANQLAALRRLRAAFGSVWIIEVISNDPSKEPRMADSGRMTPEEHG